MDQRRRRLQDLPVDRYLDEGARREMGPTPARIAARPEWADERGRPAFLLVADRR